MLRLLLGRATTGDWRRRCASLETCGGPEGGTRELLTGSLPGLCGAVRSERSFGLTVSRLWRPCCVRERQSRARSRDAAVRRSRAEGGPAATRVPSKRPPAPDPSPPAARPGATGSAAVRGEAPRSCFVPNGPVTWGRGRLGYLVPRTRNILGENLLKNKYRRERT